MSGCPVYLDNEFNKWLAACGDGNVELPTAAHVEQKIKGRAAAAAHFCVIHER
jgi:hypothetical protein